MNPVQVLLVAREVQNNYDRLFNNVWSYLENDRPRNPSWFQRFTTFVSRRIAKPVTEQTASASLPVQDCPVPLPGLPCPAPA